jgi:AcrR family transcriptional regulator
MPRILDKMDENILEVSRELFLTRGLRATEMKDIAVRAGIGRSTLYRHFNGKEIIAFYIAKDILTGLRELTKTESERLNSLNSGYEKLEETMLLFTSKVIENRDKVRFLDEFDQYFTDDYPASEEADEYIQFNKNKDTVMYQYFL